MRALPPDAALLAALERRVGRLHARLRLGIEAEHEAQVFGQGRTFFHIENWYSIHGLMGASKNRHEQAECQEPRSESQRRFKSIGEG